MKKELGDSSRATRDASASLPEPQVGLGHSVTPTIARHTAGPWRVKDETEAPRRAFAIVSHLDREVARYLAFDDHLRFAYTTARPEEVEANAHLIAAAPDLLAACKDFAEAQDEGLDLTEPARLIRAAIAKAEGV